MCFFSNPALDRKKWKLTSSGIWNGQIRGQSYLMEHVVDGLIGNHDKAFVTYPNAFNWLQIDFGVTVYKIARILLIKRADLGSSKTPARYDV